MDTFYKTTPLEQWVETFYKRNKISSPNDLSIDNIARKLNIWIHYIDERSRGLEIGERMYTMIIDSRLSPEEQWLEFLHELCHLLRHAGNQLVMPELFTKAQEDEAERFVMYAAIPFFMLRKTLLPGSEDEAAGLIGKVFRVPPKFAKQRLTQIKERIAGAEFMATLTYTAAAREEGIPEPINSDPVIRGIYGLDDLSRPHTLVIEQREGFDWERPLHIVVDGCFKSIDAHPYNRRDTAVVSSGDLSISGNRADCLTINMSRVAWRHGKTATRLFLPMEAVDDAINF